MRHTEPPLIHGIAPAPVAAVHRVLCAPLLIAPIVCVQRQPRPACCSSAAVHTSHTSHPAASYSANTAAARCTLPAQPRPCAGAAGPSPRSPSTAAITRGPCCAKNTSSYSNHSACGTPTAVALALHAPHVLLMCMCRSCACACSWRLLPTVRERLTLPAVTDDCARGVGAPVRPCAAPVGYSPPAPASPAAG